MLLHLGLCLLVLAPQGASSATIPARPAVAAQPAPAVSSQGATSMFGEPVVVHGRRITDDEIQRFLCASVGGRDFDTIKFSILVDEELQKLAQQGASAEQLGRYEVSDADLDARLARERDDFLLRYPTLDFAVEVGRSELSLELFRERLRQTMRFDRVFRPENPLEWPEITKAIIAEQLGETWFDDERVSYASRVRRLFDTEQNILIGQGYRALLEKLAAIDPRDTTTLVAAIDEPDAVNALAVLKAAGKGEIPADDPIAVDAVRSTILVALNTWAIVQSDHDEIAAALPPAAADAPKDAAAALARARSVMAIVNGQPIMMDTIWSRIAPFCTSDLVDEAKRFLAEVALLEHEFAAKGTLLTPAQFREWWPSTSKQGKPSYSEYLSQHEMLSSQVLGFPSLPAFATYIRVQESYKRVIAADLARDELLAPTLPVINQIAGASRLSVDVLFVSAFDFPNNRWKASGFPEARERALAIKSDLDKGAEWRPTLELYSEFWDPPMPESGNKPMQNFYFKGTFGDQPQTRNQLQGYIGDSDYRSFLFGTAVTDQIFFEQKMGSIDGPWRGPKGYYMARITGKTPPTRPLDLSEPKHREIVEYYYLKNSMAARALALLREGITSGAVKGLTPPPGLAD
ncbi:MAG: hypothetical protein FJ294_03215 [Planctomycetes bacterium]|nr:hypothetical protein [Planctomycetota bacterium]